MVNTLIILAQRDFRDEEYSMPRQALETAGFNVRVASPQGGLCTGTMGLEVEADYSFDEVIADDFDALVVVGGGGSKKQLWNNKRLHEIINTVFEKGKVVAGICLSTVALAKAGVLEGRTATVFETPETLEELRNFGVDYVGGEVVADGKVITASGPSAAEKFAKKIVEKIASS